jgi:hypothetical protein
MPSGFNNRPPAGQRLADNVASQVSGIFSTRPTAKYMSGARCILKINGNIAGFAFGISWRTTTNAIEINTIDDYTPWELAPQRITVEGSISALHIPGQSAGTQLWQADVLSFLSHRYITIEVRDIATDSLLFFTNKAFITSRSEDLRVDQLSQVQLSFKAIGFRDEREPQLPIDPTPPTRTGNPTIDNVQKNPTAFNNDLLSKAADISKKFFA